VHYDENDRMLQRAIAAPVKFAGNTLKTAIKKALALLAKKAALWLFALIVKVLGALAVAVGIPALLIIGITALVTLFAMIFIGNPFTLKSEMLDARKAGYYAGKAMAIYIDIDEEGWDEEADQKLIELYKSYENRCLEGLTSFEQMQARQYALPFELIMSIDNAEIVLWDSTMMKLRGLKRWEPNPEETYKALKTKYKWIEDKVIYKTKFIYSYFYSYYYDEYIPPVICPVTQNILREGYRVTHFVSDSRKDVPVEEEIYFKVRLLKEANTFDNIYVFEYGDYITTKNLAEGERIYLYKYPEKYSTIYGVPKKLKFTGYCVDNSGKHLPPSECSGPFANMQYEVGDGSFTNPFTVTANPAFFAPETFLYIESKGYAIAKQVPDLSLSDGIGILLPRGENINFGQQNLNVWIINDKKTIDIKSEHDPYSNALLGMSLAEQIDAQAKVLRKEIEKNFHPDAYNITYEFSYEIIESTKTYRPVVSVTAAGEQFERLKKYAEERFGQKISPVCIELLLSGALDANPNLRFHYTVNLGDIYFSGYDLNITYNKNFDSPLIWPVPFQYKQRISSPFGYRIHPIYGNISFHGGIDIAREWGAPWDALLNKPVLAAMDGIIVFSGWIRGFGNCVIIDHGINKNLGKNVRTLYAHLDSLVYKKSGIEVYAGDIIGTIGSTGDSTGPHLHFEIHLDGKRVNPLDFYPPSLYNSLL